MAAPPEEVPILFRPVVQEAVSLVNRAHAGQFRKDGVTPYAAHVVRVALTALYEFECRDEAVLLGALLHDTLEDTDLGYDDLRADFGQEVADIVVVLTKDKRLPSEERDRVYYANLEKADWKCRLIKAADSLDNMREGISTGKRPKAAKKVRKALEMLHGQEACLQRARERLEVALQAESEFRGNA